MLAIDDRLAQTANTSWTLAMRQGDFVRAWRISDGVLWGRVQSGETCWHWPRHLQYVWRGDPLAGRRVLVRCYHGLGDTLQFIRFAAPLRRLAREVIVWAQPALLPLVATAPGVDRALPLHDGVPEVEYDVDVEVMEIPHALRTTLAALPRDVPYLSAPPPHADIRRDGRFCIGLVWQAGDWDTRRSVPARLMARLGHIPGLRLLSLQRGRARGEAATIGAEDVSSDDVSQAAAVIRALDLVISVDTMAAHLAGALAAPVWTLLHAECDWRWMDRRTDSPWYPTMRLFRQSAPGDWKTVIDAVGSALAQRLV